MKSRIRFAFDSRGAYRATFGVLLIAAAMVRFSLPLIPFSDADTWGYLHPAITLFTRGDFVHTYARSFVYPLCIHVVLRIFGDYAALSVVQHLSGLGAALILLVTWNRIPHFVNLPSPFPEAHRWLGLVPFGMYLFSATTIELEHTIRPEAIFPFVAAIFLYASMRTLEAAVARAPRDRRVDVFGGAAVFLVCVLYFLRPHAAFLLPFTLVGVSACAVWIKVGVYRTVRILVVPGLLAATLLWLPEHVLSRRDPDAQRFLPATLLFFHLDMISDVMRRDLANPSFARQDLAVRDTLTMLIRAYEEEQADREGKAGASYPTLGFDADALFYGAPGNALAKHFEGDLEGYRRFCFGYFLRAVIADPARYVKKVYRQLRIFYAIRPRPYSTQYTIDVPSQFTASYRALGDPSYFEEIEQHAVSLDYYRALATTPTRRFYGVGARRLSRAAKAWYQRLEYMYVPALGSAMIAAMALGVLRLRGSARDDVVRGTLLLGLAAFVCAGQTFVFLLAPASIHTLEIGRYVWLQYLVIIFSEFLMLWFLAAVVLALTEGIVARAKAEPIVAREKIGNRVNK